MRLMHHLFGSAIPMFAHIATVFYVCQRFLAATRLRRKLMTETREFTSIVDRARGNVQYIGEQVARGMKEMKGDVGEELRVTDRLTAQSSKLAGVLKRFATLEENVLELVRMDRNRENARIETPTDVNEEIRRIVAASERKRNGQRGQHRAKLTERAENEAEVVAGAEAEAVAVADADARRSTGRDPVHRNPLSKFSACSPREVGFVARKPIDDRPRTPTMPEVRLLGERVR